jgi:UDP-glucose 4-epimerase|tara:strand:- start:893 stop:1798 length:906 start_codon:yes stop_codon:yes gene_type:complete
MKVLVTGGVGFIGTNLIKRLLDDGHEVFALDNYSTGFKENEQDGCKYYNIDISKKFFWKLSDSCFCEVTCDCQIEKPDVIFHLAALARVQPSFKNPQEVFENNVLGTQNVLNYARDKNIPVVYAGSSTAHGDHFANPYSFTKRQGELLCEMYNKVFKLPTVTTRFYNVYGEHQILEGAYAAVIGIFEKQYSDGKTLTVTGDGEQRRDFTNVEDIVDGLVRCGNILVTDNNHTISGKIFELGRGVNYSINEITEMFGQKEVEYIPARPGEMEVTLCESVEARELLGWNPTIDIKDYIEGVIK